MHPAVGLTRPGDLDYVTRVRACRALLDERFDPRRTLLRLLPLAMRMAGPREALWHALVRRNYGASHFIVGRDHAGPGPDSSGRPLFGPFEAQELALRHEDEMGVTIVPLRRARVPARPGSLRRGRPRAPATRVARLSGTDVRDRLARGEPLPEWFTRPEVAEVLRSAHPPRFEDGFCVWFTGLPASGKSSSAEALAALLVERGRRVTVLDGDVVRTHLSQGLGFSRVDRDANVLRIGFVAAEIVKHRGVALCAAVSPYREARDRCRALVGAARFVEVFVDTPLRLCEERDPKGLYARARRGEVSRITGIDDPYEPPERPEVVLHTDDATVLDNARLVVPPSSLEATCERESAGGSPWARPPWAARSLILAAVAWSSLVLATFGRHSLVAVLLLTVVLLLPVGILLRRVRLARGQGRRPLSRRPRRSVPLRATCRGGPGPSATSIPGSTWPTAPTSPAAAPWPSTTPWSIPPSTCPGPTPRVG